MKAIRVAGGNAYAASSYGYPLCAVFEYTTCVLKSGEVSFGPGRLLAGPFRSRAKAERIGRQLASERGVEFREGYGSLRGKRVNVSSSVMVKGGRNE